MLNFAPIDLRLPVAWSAAEKNNLLNIAKLVADGAFLHEDFIFQHEAEAYTFLKSNSAVNTQNRKLIIEYEILNDDEAVIHSFMHPSSQAKVHFYTPITVIHLNRHIFASKDVINLTIDDIEIGFSDRRGIGLKELQSAISELKTYGEVKADDKKNASELADSLNHRLKTFIANASFTKQDFTTLKDDFNCLLNEKKSTLSIHQAYYRVIIANILIALTGFGLMAIAGKLLVSGDVFFAQTKRRNHVGKSVEAMNNFSLNKN